jgi:hypothetical protein
MGPIRSGYRHDGSTATSTATSGQRIRPGAVFLWFSRGFEGNLGGTTWFSDAQPNLILLVVCACIKLYPIISHYIPMIVLKSIPIYPHNIPMFDGSPQELSHLETPWGQSGFRRGWFHQELRSPLTWCLLVYKLPELKRHPIKPKRCLPTGMHIEIDPTIYPTTTMILISRNCDTRSCWFPSTIRSLFLTGIRNSEHARNPKMRFVSTSP